MPSAKLSAIANISAPAVGDLLYGEQGSVEKSYPLDRLLAFLVPNLINGRLTTETGVPISTADRTAQGTIYFTPYNGNRVCLYDGTRWRLYTFTERSLALTVTSAKNYDVFLYDNAGTLTLELSAAWTNDTTRADALATQDGIWCKSGALTRRWLGTIRASGTNTTEDSEAKRFVANVYNRVLRRGRKAEATAHQYTSTTARYWNNDSTQHADFVVPDPQWITVSIWGGVDQEADVGAQLDWSSGAAPKGQYLYVAGTNEIVGVAAFPLVVTAAGYHFVAVTEEAYNAAPSGNNLFDMALTLGLWI